MEFWGIEVKSGQPLKVENELDKLLHLSHATLGESKVGKGNESVSLFVKIDDQKLVLGTLSTDNIPQLNFDLVFEKEFELSHNWKNGSVFFMGYKNVMAEDYESGSESESDDDIPLHLENGKSETKVEPVKPSKTKASVKPESSDMPKVKAVDAPKKDKSKEDDDDEYNSDELDDSDDEDDVKMGDAEDDSSDEDDEDISDEDEEEDEDTPEKAEPSKKRLGESAIKTPVPAKKAKFSSPQKTDGKKGVHTATPHPSKQVGKTPAENMKSGGNKNAPTPNSSGTKVTCKSCSKTFNSESGLQSHTKAKHSGK